MVLECMWQWDVIVNLGFYKQVKRWREFMDKKIIAFAISFLSFISVGIGSAHFISDCLGRGTDHELFMLITIGLPFLAAGVLFEKAKNI